MKSYFLIGSNDRLYELMPDKSVSIGRSAINQIVLDDRIVSRVHARITYGPKGFLLTDHKSANGTHINGRIAQEAVLNHGDSIQIGKFIFSVVAGTRAEAELWLKRRGTDTKTDNTITDLNLNTPRVTDMIGDLSAIDLVSLVQTFIEQRRQGCLELTDYGQSVGKIYLTNGMIVFAETVSGHKGKAAFFQLIGTDRGQFIFRPDINPPSLAIMDNPTALLLEACRQLDEIRAAAHAH